MARATLRSLDRFIQDHAPICEDYGDKPPLWRTIFTCGWCSGEGGQCALDHYANGWPRVRVDRLQAALDCPDVAEALGEMVAEVGDEDTAIGVLEALFLAADEYSGRKYGPRARLLRPEFAWADYVELARRVKAVQKKVAVPWGLLEHTDWLHQARCMELATAVSLHAHQGCGPVWPGLYVNRQCCMLFLTPKRGWLHATGALHGVKESAAVHPRLPFEGEDPERYAEQEFAVRSYCRMAPRLLIPRKDIDEMRTIERGGPMSAPYGIGWGRSLRLRNEPSLADAYEAWNNSITVARMCQLFPTKMIPLPGGVGAMVAPFLHYMQGGDPPVAPSGLGRRAPSSSEGRPIAGTGV